MDTDTNTTSSAAVVELGHVAADAGDASRELAHVDQAVEAERYRLAQARAAEIVALSIEKLKGAIVGLSIYELARVLEAEEAKGEDSRKGAIEAIQAQAETVALATVEASEASPPLPAAEVSPPAADDGDMTIDPTGLDVTPPAAPDVIAEAAAAVAAEPSASVAVDGIGGRFIDRSADVTDAEALEIVKSIGAILVVGRRDFPHVELTPVRAGPGDFARAHDARRIIYTGSIELDGIGLPAPLPIEQVWLVVAIADEAPSIIRRCDIPGELTLGVGRHVALRANTLIF